MKVINLFSGPSGGKSTTAAGLFYKMKLAGHKVELVTEYAKELVYSNRLSNMLDQQEYIFAKQNHRLHILRSQVDFAIVDSPILLSAVYVDRDSWSAAEQFIDFVVAVNNTYDNQNFFIERPDTYETYGRVHTLQESKELDDTIKSVVLSCDVRGLTSIPVKTAVDKIYETLFKED